MMNEIDPNARAVQRKYVEEYIQFREKEIKERLAELDRLRKLLDVLADEKEEGR